MNTTENPVTIHLVNPAIIGREIKASIFGAVAEPLSLGVIGSEIMSITDKMGLRKAEMKVNYVDEHRGDKLKVAPGDLVFVTTMMSTAGRSAGLAKEIAEKEAICVFGGPDATLRPNHYQQNGGIVFSGWAGGSAVFSGMIKEVLHSGKLKNNLYLSEGLSNSMLQALPINSEIYRMIDSRTFLKSTWLSAGCTFSCTFCAANMLSSGKMYHRPAGEVAEEIKKRKLPGFALIDSNPALVGDAWNEFIELMIRNPVAEGWTVELSKNWLMGKRADELLKMLQRSRCQRIMVGLESLNPANLRDIKKNQNITKEDILVETRDMIRRVHRYGIKLTLLLIVGFEKDTKETILQLVDRIEDLGADGANIFVLTPYPKTQLWDELVAKGLFDPDEYQSEDFDCRHMVWRHPMGKKELERAYKDLAKQVWSMTEIVRRSKDAWKLSKSQQNSLGRLKSSVLFELGCAQQHHAF